MTMNKKDVPPEPARRRGRPKKENAKLNQQARSSLEATRAAANPENVAEIAALLGKMYDIADVAAALNVTARTIHGYLTSGKLHGVKFGGAWRISAENLQKFLRGE